MGLKISIISIIFVITIFARSAPKNAIFGKFWTNFLQNRTALWFKRYSKPSWIGLKDTPNHLELKFMGKNNKKPFGLKIQSTTSDQLHPIPFKSLKSLLWFEKFFALFSRKVEIDASNKDIKEPGTLFKLIFCLANYLMVSVKKP